MFERFMNILYLILYFRKKRKSIFLADFRVRKWVATLTENDIGEFRMEIPLSTGTIIGVRVIGVDRIEERVCDNVRLNIEYINGIKDIRDCTFHEFITYYAHTILYIRSCGGVLDIVKESKVYISNQEELKLIKGVVNFD